MNMPVAITRTYLSLKWKVLLTLVVTLSLVHLAGLMLLYYQERQDFAQARQQVRGNDLAALNGTVQDSYRRLIDIAQLLPYQPDDAGAEPQAASSTLVLDEMSVHIGRHAQDIVLQGIVDLVRLYRADAWLVGSWGDDAAIIDEDIVRAFAREQPVRNIVCDRNCLRYVAVPVMMPGDKAAVILVGSLMHDVVQDYRRLSEADIGLVRLDAGHRKIDEVLSLTNRTTNLALLDRLELVPNRLAGEAVYGIEADGRHYELVLAPLDVEGAEGINWLLISDISAALASQRQRFLLFSLLATGGTLAALLLQFWLLRRPLDYLRQLARCLPLLASSGERHGGQVDREPPVFRQRAFADELDVLSGSAAELARRLDQLEDSVQDRTVRLERRSADLLRERDFVSSLFDTAEAVILTQDRVGRILSLNRFGCRLLGLDPERLSEYRFTEVVLGPGDEAARGQMQRLYRAGVSRLAMDSRYRTPGGREIQLSWQHSSLADSPPEQAAILSIAIDMTERRDAESRLYWLANHDALTRLPNRLLFFDDLRQRLADIDTGRRQVAVLCCDVDDFKDVNDTLGHRIGDKLLQAVARRIFELTGEAYGVSRLGADEFALMLEGDDVHDAAAETAEHLIRVFVEPFHIEGYELYTSICIGISLAPQHGFEASDLLRHADLAMNEAKGQGQGRYRFYHEAQGSSRVERFTLANDLRRATEQGGFILHYQPKVNARTGQVIGMEALLRWPHPELGMISPARFIPLAEEMGLIVPIGRWVLVEACRQMAEWQAAGMASMRIGVNLAGPQIAHDSLIDQVDQALQSAGLSPRQLDLEITESFAIRQPELTIAKLNQLRERGISLSMDDFGTGYSSLSYLKRLPIDTLKIDQSFVRDIGRDGDDEAIVRAIILMCRSLGIDVLAEGVETQEQLDFLLLNGCEGIQGYYYSKPLPADEFPAFVRRQQAARTPSIEAQ